MNIINKLFTFFKKDQNNIQNNIYENLVILPEDIRYQMKYNKGIIWEKEIKVLLTESFGMIWVYLMLKYYEGNQDLQEAIIKTITNNIMNKRKLYEEMNIILDYNSLWIEIDWKKIGIMNKYWFNGLDNKFREIVLELNNNKKVPIIILYAGILSLEQFLQYYNWDEIRLFNYKEILYTYKLERNNNNWTVKREQISTIEEKEYAIVDDMSATRKSYNNTISRIQEITHYTKDIELYTAININL